MTYFLIACSLFLTNSFLSWKREFMLQCVSGTIGLFMLLMGLTALYAAFFNRKSLVEGHPKASPEVTAAIAVVMGSLITYIGFTLATHALGG